jgi:hypothetical protein
MKFLVKVCAVTGLSTGLISNTCLAWPVVGDTVTYHRTSTYSGGPVAPGTITCDVAAMDSKSDTLALHCILRNDESGVSTEMDFESSLSQIVDLEKDGEAVYDNCVAKYQGEQGIVNVKGKTYRACKVVGKQYGCVSTEWFANVPYGIIKQIDKCNGLYNVTAFESFKPKK